MDGKVSATHVEIVSLTSFSVRRKRHFVVSPTHPTNSFSAYSSMASTDFTINIEGEVLTSDNCRNSAFFVMHGEEQIAA